MLDFEYKTIFQILVSWYEILYEDFGRQMDGTSFTILLINYKSDEFDSYLP